MRRPEIYISAGPELSAYRKAAKLALGQLGAQTAEHQDFTTEYGPLQGVLSLLIAPCEAVVHIATARYGIEPAERTLGATRRSFPQYEIDVAHALGKPIYIFLPSPGAPLDAAPPEDDERRHLQQRHLDALRRSGHHVETIADPEDLSRKLRALRQAFIVRHELVRLPRPPLGELFVGRAQVSASLREELTAGSAIVLQPWQEAAGRGGAGTTALAVELGWRLHEEGRFPYVLFVPAGPRADMEAALAAYARNNALALLPEEVAAPRARLEAVIEWLKGDERRDRVLIIVDGADTEMAIWSTRMLLPVFAKSAVLITSRLTSWRGLRTHQIGPWTSEQGRAYCEMRLHGERAPQPAERLAIDRLVAALGRSPLGITLAAAHLVECRQTAATFLALVQPSTQGGGAALRLTLQSVLEESSRQLSREARQLFRLLLCLAPQPSAIPLALFENRADWPQLREQLEELARRHLLDADEEGRTISVHRLVREIVRDGLPPHDLAEALAGARNAVDAALPHFSGAQGAATRELLIPHCRALLGQLNGHPLEANAAGIARSLAHWLKEYGRPREAEPFYRRALAIEERNRGANSPELAARLLDLAGNLRALRRSREAEPLLRRALAISERTNGRDRLENIPALEQLASCLRATGEMEEAEALYRRALAIEEQLSGYNHPRVALQLHNLAGVLEVARRPREAEVLYRRALSMDEERFGLNHPRVPVRIHHLGIVLASMRRDAEAEELFQRAIALEEAKLGPMHPEVAPGLRNLAGLLDTTGRIGEAAVLYRRVLTIDEAALGAAHPEVACDCANLASVLLDLGEAAEAETLHRRALEIFSRAALLNRGQHPHLRTAARNWAGAARALGMEEDAIAATLRGFMPVAPHRLQEVFTLPEDENS